MGVADDAGRLSALRVEREQRRFRAGLLDHLGRPPARSAPCSRPLSRMPWLRGNLHAHTTFSDGVRQPAQLVAERETLHVLNHPARYQLTVAQTLERIRRIGAGGIALDAIEVTDTGQRRPLYESPEIPLAKIATDDAHGPIHFGRAWVEVDAARSRDAIIRAIRAGEFRLGFAA